MSQGDSTPAKRGRIGYHALLLGGMAALTGGALVLGNQQTRDDIAARQAEDLKASLSQVVPADLHDNDLLKDTVTLDTAKGRTVFYRAREKGAVTAVAYKIIGQGYGGEIDLVMGVDTKGDILGVRVIAHSETPGLGDNIEVKKSHWIFGFNGRSLSNTTAKQWHVKKDGGIFDQFTGATITPRGVVKAVYEGLEEFRANRTALLAAERDAAPTEPKE